MITGIKANFETLDLAELCANKIRKTISGSKSIKIVSKRLHNQELPATYSFSARSENWVSTPLSILSVTRTNENLSTIPPRLINSTDTSNHIRLEVICDDSQLRNVYRLILSSGGSDIRNHYQS